MDLTPKQEKFVQGLVEGKTQREAYQQAYNCEKMNDNTIRKKASDLFNKDYIRGAYDTLKSEKEKEAKEVISWSLERSLNALTWLMDKSIESMDKKGLNQSNSNAYLGSVKEINNITGISFKDKTDYELKKARLELDKSKLEGAHNETIEKDGVIDEMLEGLKDGL